MEEEKSYQESQEEDFHKRVKQAKSGAKTKSKKQVGYLLSKGSPLTKGQQDKLKSELHSGKVKVKK